MFFNHTKSDGLNQPKGGSPRKKHKEEPFSPSLKSNIDTFTKLLGHSSDLEIKPFVSGLAPEITMSLVYLSEMVNEASLNESVLRPLMKGDKQAEERSNDLIHLIKEQIIQVGSTYCTDSIEEAIDMLLNGYCLLLVQEASSGLMINVSSKEGRTVSEPTTQTVLRGPQQSFNEILSTNINLMRQIIKSPDLHIESMVIGSQTRTQIAMLYLDGVASAEAVKTVRERLQSIEVSGILESGHIEEFIQEKNIHPSQR